MSKIAIVYEYGTESWSTPSSLILEFAARGWEVKRFHLTQMSKEDELNLFYFKPDICLVMDWKGLNMSIHVETVLRNNGTWLIKEVGDCPQNLNNHIAGGLRQYYHLLCPDYPSCIELLSLGHATSWFNHFADTRIHSCYLGHDTYPSVRSTRGPGGSQFLDELSRIMPDKFINKNGLTGKAYGAFLNNGLITVQNSRHKEITRRIFEGAACGTLVITDRLPEKTNIDTMFVEDHDIVYYDTMAECISKINYYLNDPRERNRITLNGRKKVTEEHTQTQRVIQILGEYKRWKN